MLRIIPRIVFFFSVILALTVNSQDQSYSQFFNNYNYYNPAYPGLQMGLNIYANYRNQWTGLPYDFNSYNVSMDISAYGIPGVGGIGIIAQSNNEGDGLIKNTYGALQLSSRIPINSRLRSHFGVYGAFVQRKTNFDELVFPDQLNSVYGNIYNTKFVIPAKSTVSYPDFGFGGILNYYASKLNGNLGFSIQHLFQPPNGLINTDSKLPRKLVFHGDILVFASRSYSKSNEGTKIFSGFLVENQQVKSSYSLGISGYKSSIYLGLWFRNADLNFNGINSLIFLTGTNIPMGSNTRIRIMYSFEYVMNNVPSFGSTHEIGLFFNISEVTINESSKYMRRNNGRNGNLMF